MDTKPLLFFDTAKSKLPHNDGIDVPAIQLLQPRYINTTREDTGTSNMRDKSKTSPSTHTWDGEDVTEGTVVQPNEEPKGMDKSAGSIARISVNTASGIKPELNSCEQRHQTRRPSQYYLPELIKSAP